MPIPRRLPAEPIAPSLYSSIATAIYDDLEFDPGTGCRCPERAAGGCVDDLDLTLQGWYLHTDGREGVFVRRRRVLDADSKVTLRTEVAFRSHNAHGQPVYWALKCAGPLHVENEYERARTSRPPASARLPFQPATSVGS
ncbi:hypothetical protein [Kitasatospora sp. NBC_01300]|uniref:hypothetical protein n=1 Tax=Kitasatospora sp. NBC_01300 TaxID=2903574 RepID=UPI00352F2EA7|nr:hypothetical protein OG556_18265 [Kitasatospora sp. NBC_01300]